MLVDWAGCDLLMPKPAPYRYELIAEGNITAFPDLALRAPAKLAIRKFAVRHSDSGADLAELHVADLGEGAAPVLLDWQNATGAVPLALAGRPQDLDLLAEAVAEHVPDDALLLAWWDTSRQLAALTGVAILYDENLPRPLIVPPEWIDRRKSIESLERVFWRLPEDGGVGFGRFLDAMAATPAKGARALAEIAGGRRAFITVQLADAYKLALARPQIFGVGYRDFSRTGDIHSDIRQVKDWLAKQGFSIYAVELINVARNRVYYLADEKTAGSLLAGLLPFGEFEPLELEELKLVANYGSYWVYEIMPPIAQ